ncbi:hypothetical protein Dsin_009814 [Dipteronia sinensis]|uniref:Uncharacterized protein n=1 Tax=Dipteronia sinensis TaxID=43782 RepID=A0AAE0ECA3_9ROSI|nr:hypothetical protein Dsin_009814 [Dipteronia sinensis]
MEKLSHIINHKLIKGSWKPVKISRGGPAISHLFFTNDLILFGQASLQQAQVMKDYIDIFCDLSGQQISFPKYRIYCSKNVSNSNTKTIVDICNSHITKNLGKYLGVPLVHGRVTKDIYKKILDKTQNRLATWKNATLSFAGRCTLIKSVSLAILIYAMQSIKLSTEICSKLNQLNKDFLWGHTADSKKLHLVNWDTICLPKYLKCSTPTLGKIPDYLLFTVALWFIWKWRCKDVFKSNFESHVCAGKVIMNFVEDWFKANSESDNKTEMKTCYIAWSPPETDWIKLNVDRSLNPELGTISAGGVIRNHMKNWLGGFVLNRASNMSTGRQ